MKSEAEKRLVARTIRVPKWLDEEVQRMVREDPLQTTDYTAVVRRALFNELERLKDAARRSVEEVAP